MSKDNDDGNEAMWMSPAAVEIPSASSDVLMASADSGDSDKVRLVEKK